MRRSPAPDQGKHRSGAPLLLVALLLLALVLRVGVALRWPSLSHSDEIFQTLEPAHRLAFGPGVVTWEWRDGIRSWVFPAFLAGIMRATSWIGVGSSGYLSAIAVVLSLLSLTTVWFAWAWGKRASGIPAAVIGAGAAAIWWQLVFLAPRALNEVVAGNVLLVGLYLGVYGDRFPETKRLLLAGFCCGLAMALRVQLAPAVAFASLWFCHPGWRRRMPAVALGLLVPIVAFGLVDAFTWSYPFQSFVRYVWANVVEGKSLRYGTESWYWYGWILLQYFGLLLLLALAGVRRSPFLGWMALAIVATHSVFAHKEVRFLYPVMPIVIALAALGFADVAEYIGALFKPRLGHNAIVAAGLAICAIVSGSYAWGYPAWTNLSGGQVSLNRLSPDPTVCGVGLYSVNWSATGGYAHLHRNVPILIVPDSALERDAPSFNALMAGNAAHIDPTGEFKLVESWRDVSLYRRVGSCTAPGGDEINTALRRTGF